MVAWCRPFEIDLIGAFVSALADIASLGEQTQQHAMRAEDVLTALEDREARRAVRDASVIRAIRGHSRGHGEAPGLRNVCAVRRQARTGINPQTREPTQIAASKSAKFAIGSEFEQRVDVSASSS
jgi:Bacterial DNA-binding protein